MFVCERPELPGLTEAALLVRSLPRVQPGEESRPDQLGEKREILIVNLYWLSQLTMKSLGGCVSRLITAPTSPVVRKSPAAKYM